METMILNMPAAQFKDLIRESLRQILLEDTDFLQQLLRQAKPAKPRKPKKAAPAKDEWSLLGNMIGTVEGPADWAAEIDHYLYHTPKRGKAL